MVKLPNKANQMLEYFRSDEVQPDNFIFPYITDKNEIDTPLKLHNTVGKKTALLNKYLKELANLAGISKKLTMHVSRHTFATEALRRGVRIEYVSKLLGHADLKETQIYTKIINEELDKAMEVFND